MSETPETEEHILFRKGYVKIIDVSRKLYRIANRTSRRNLREAILEYAYDMELIYGACMEFIQSKQNET